MTELFTVLFGVAGFLLLAGSLLKASSPVDWLLYWWRLRWWLAVLTVVFLAWSYY